MNFWDWLIIISVAGAVGLAAAVALRARKRGSSCCSDGSGSCGACGAYGAGCAGCPGCGQSSEPVGRSGCPGCGSGSNSADSSGSDGSSDPDGQSGN